MTRQTHSTILSYSTVRIETIKKDGTKSTGTGYFYALRYDPKTNRSIKAIITNKHVVRDSEKGFFTISTTDDYKTVNHNQHIRIPIDDFEEHWLGHPDKNVDLCFMMIAPIEEILKTQYDKKLFFYPINSSMMPTKEQLNNLSSLEEILMIGYPNGIWDEYNNRPILRKGITATHPRYDYNSKKEFLIDAACFPGSSGSPVFIVNERGYYENGTYFMDRSRVLFLGTLYAGPQHPIIGDIGTIKSTTSTKSVSLSRVPNNLGYIIRFDRVLELEQLEILDNPIIQLSEIDRTKYPI